MTRPPYMPSRRPTAPPPLPARVADHRKRPRPQDTAPPPESRLSAAPSLPPLDAEAAPVELRAAGEMLLRTFPTADALAALPTPEARHDCAVGVLAAHRGAVAELAARVGALLNPLYERVEASGTLDESAALDRRTLETARELAREAGRRCASAECAATANLPIGFSLRLRRLTASIAAATAAADEARATLARDSRAAATLEQMKGGNRARHHVRRVRPHQLAAARLALEEAEADVARLTIERETLNQAAVSKRWAELESFP